VKMIAGEWSGHKGPGPERTTEPFIADVTLQPNSEAAIPVTYGHAGFIYVFEGELRVGDETVRSGKIGVLSDSGALEVSAAGQGARFLIVAGKPLREPIAKYGPFVMNTADEIRTAIHDYQSGRF
jgi:redox-sensitive bicupin YhaK (pirin superfamily)